MRTAVILCAGTGSRLRQYADGTPKPLVRVAGREILYRTVSLLREEGIENFVFVVNPGNRRAIEGFVQTLNISYKLVLNEHPERENGYSLYLAGEEVREDRFVLTMGDHLYSADFISRAVKGEGLIVDTLALYTDREEATKVLCERGRIREIGKSVKEFTGYDTGFFVLDRSIFSTAGRLAREREKLTLSEVVKEAGVKCFYVSGEFWTDIDTPEDIARARRGEAC